MKSSICIKLNLQDKLLQHLASAYFSAQIKILQDLQNELESAISLIDLNNPKRLAIEAFIKHIELLIKGAQSDPALSIANFANYPDLWSKTNRLGATRIAASKEEDEQDKDNKKENSLYEQTQAILKKLNWQVPWFSKDFKAARAAIKKAQKEHQENFKNNQRKFLLAAVKAKAQDLIDKLNTNDQESYQSLLPELNKFKNLIPEHSLSTRGDTLVWHKKITLLTKKLETIGKEDIADEAKQLSVLTKRLCDNYYADPLQESTVDVIRRWAKIISLLIAFPVSVVAFILTFTPLAPVGLILGIVSVVGLVPLSDSLFETAKNYFYYKRAPTYEQAFDLFVVLPFVIALAGLVPVLGFGAGALVHTATHVPVLGGVISKVCTGLAIASDFIQKFGMNFLGATANPVFIVFEIKKPVTHLFNKIKDKLKAKGWWPSSTQEKGTPISNHNVLPILPPPRSSVSNPSATPAQHLREIGVFKSLIPAATPSLLSTNDLNLTM